MPHKFHLYLISNYALFGVLELLISLQAKIPGLKGQHLPITFAQKNLILKIGSENPVVYQNYKFIN